MAIFHPHRRCTYFKWGVISIICFFCIAVLRTLLPLRTSSSEDFRWYFNAKEKILHAATWNIAAINNNPFEYWITADSIEYDDLMEQVTNFISTPQNNDISVAEVFSDKMFQELIGELKTSNIDFYNETISIWNRDFRNRKIISEFIKDPLLGKKRLISMADRVTNTIHSNSAVVHMRPTVINCYQGQLNSVSEWWKLWKRFIFHTEIRKKGSGIAVKTVSFIPKIEKSKYPAVSFEEEKISIPLSIVSLALFDSILVHMMNRINSSLWQTIRDRICKQCNFRKHERIFEILLSSYSFLDVVFLQEVAGEFFREPKNSNIFSVFEVVQSKLMDDDRDQNSFILLKKNKYIDVHEVTESVLSILSQNSSKGIAKAPIVPGDLIAITAVDISDKTKYLFASFHGDTNGLATKSIVHAVHSYAVRFEPSSKLLFGLDANSYSNAEKDQLGVSEFADFFRLKNLNSCYGSSPNPTNYTTFHARTHLQPQLNKAVSLRERHTIGDKNLKDFILFFNSDFEVIQTLKDNTGSRKYVENMVFPTYDFPSDHGITSTVLKQVVQ